EMFISGNRIEIDGFRGANHIVGGVRFDSATRRMRITPTAQADGKPAPQPIEYAYEFKRDELTLTDADKVSVSLQRRKVIEKPLANVQVEFVTANGFNDAGDLLLTEFRLLHVGQAQAMFYQPESRVLHTKHGAVLLMQDAGLKKVTLDEARRLIRP